MALPLTPEYKIGNVINIEKWFTYNQKVPEGYRWVIENVTIKNIPKLNRPNWKWQMYGSATFEDSETGEIFKRPFQTDALYKFDRQGFHESLIRNQKRTAGGTNWEVISVDYIRYRRLKLIKQPYKKVAPIMKTIIVDGKEHQVSEKALKAFLKTQT